MFSVLFEVHPHAAQWDTYLARAKMLFAVADRSAVPGSDCEGIKPCGVN